MAIERASHEERARPTRGNGGGLSKGLTWVGIGLGVAALAAVLTSRRRAAVAAAAVSGVAAVSALRSTGRARRARKATSITRAITVNRPVDEVYRFWRDFQNLPRFMRHLEAVRVLDGNRSRWTAKGPVGTTIEWDAEIVEDVPNERIAWRSLEGAQLSNAGRVRFAPAPGGRGTEVHVEMREVPPGGRVTEKVAKLVRQAPEQKIADDLRAFKQVMETGEIMISEASALPGPHPGRPLDERDIN